MAALLKSGKFIRMVTGLARPGQNQSLPPQQHSLLPLSNTTGTGNGGSTLGEKGGGLDSGGSLMHLADGSATFQAWSLSHLQNALPVLAGVSQTEEERKDNEDPLINYLVDKQKMEEFCNQTWSQTQKQLVELEKELELERKALEKKDDVQQPQKESSLKSNAMFTKAKKKKITSSKRKPSTQNKKKELGRAISLNIIYEEPSQIQQSSAKEIKNEKGSTSNDKILELQHTKEIKKKDVAETPLTVQQEESSLTEINKSEPSNNTTHADENSNQQEQDTIIKQGSGIDFAATDEVEKPIANAIPNPSQITDQDSQENSGYLAPPDDNWESRLPLIDFSMQSKPDAETPPPGASGVYYSEVSTGEESNPVQVESTNISQPPDVSDVSCLAPASYVPMVQVFEMAPYTEAHWYPLEMVCRTFREQGRYWDLECLLDGSRCIRPEDRQTIYFWTLQAYADAGMFERAVALSGQLHLEGLGINFPAYHQLMSSFAAAQQSFAPTLPYSSYAYSESCQGNTSNSYVSVADGGQTDISSQTYMSLTPSDVSLVSTPRSSCPPTPCPPSAEEYVGVPKYEILSRGSQRFYQEEKTSRRSSRSSKSSMERKVSAAAANSVTQHLQRRFKKALNDKKLEECLESYYQLEKLNSKRMSIDSNPNKTAVNVTDSSSLIELLVKDDRVKEATKVAESILALDAYPIPKIFRFLLNRLASNGDVESMSNVGQYLTPRVKKEVSFDNRLCNAYLAAGRGNEYLDMLQRDVDDITRKGRTQEIDHSAVQSVKDKFPRGGAMGLLESDPQLVESFTMLAYKFAKLGYIAPMNVLWTYHFIGGRHDIATPLWQNYVQGCPQIMFQKVCQTARSTCNADLAQRLVNVLEDAPTVTMGARGIAYSCLIDVLTQQQHYIAGVEALKNGLNVGIKLEDVNRTALKRLKQGLEETTRETFPYEIPKKDGRLDNTAEFKHDSEDIYESETSVAMLN